MASNEVNGIIAGIGDEVNKINEILPELDASYLDVLFDIGVIPITNSIQIKYSESKVVVPKFFAILHGFKVYYANATELFFEKPLDSSTYYYQVFVEAKTNVVPNSTRMFIVRTTSSEIPSEYQRQDNLTQINGVCYLKLFDITVLKSGQTDASISFSINVLTKVKKAIHSDKADVMSNGSIIGKTTVTGTMNVPTQPDGTANSTVANTAFVRNAINFGNDTISLNYISGITTTGSVNELKRVGGLVLGKLKMTFTPSSSSSVVLGLPLKLGTLPNGFLPQNSNEATTNIAVGITIIKQQGTTVTYNLTYAKGELVYRSSDKALVLNNIELADNTSLTYWAKNKPLEIPEFKFGYVAEDI